MRIEEDIKLGFKDVLIRPKRSILKSRSQVDLTRLFIFKHAQNKWSGIPLIAANMDTVGTFKMAIALSSFGILTAIHKYYSYLDWKKFIHTIPGTVVKHIMVSTGMLDEDFVKLKQILSLSSKLKYICIDVANGYSEKFVTFLKKVRECYCDKIICAGNVVTGEMVEELILSGADIVKVGIGPGSVCTTRAKTAIGYPQLSAVIECSDAAHGLGGQIISDGGCVVSGDIAKAFGGGADFVMLGGMLAGHKECEGLIFKENKKRYMIFYGMSSKFAMDRHIGGVARYKTPEGKTVKVLFRGAVSETINNILGGLRSTCTYVGAFTLKELTKRTTFIKVSEQENIIFNNQEVSN
ncbi:GMP reductase [Buchnera aphidicola str. Bp (Baizongia pistaciae)]|uniref:GMP reductase n=1 Tax=Buchnera aphidicola subsp. Baizongia pistaciae (strain Bp) TaxID=224915 RepID=GUAC_BUCBP|nr:GMP reductase [Buchnera aphidicola]P59443.1 RecName: Full=GMP reductase; AltName: Full=Guanosine 5'-monophosphate oxidoreductase; Short=Guanosine monophosphate reductase [Buchnera aphidicola str. Bp (Baizongia pistaciae)]AAO26920.1 GMP reductase [Buchnera aphidicola str. Bp (Baizongia pistaciae)]